MSDGLLVQLSFVRIALRDLLSHRISKVCSGTTLPHGRLDGKVVVITGGNSGIGKEVVKDLASRGAKVVIGCRDVEKGNRVVQEIVANCPDAQVSVLAVDMASLKSVRTFARCVIKQEAVIDVLINNAGVVEPEYKETEDGLETNFAVNYLSHFLLTHLLLDRLKLSQNPKVINVSSSLHELSTLNFEDLNQKESFNYLKAYGQSKLALIMFTAQLAKRCPAVKCYSLDPGPVNTSIDRGFGQMASNFLYGLYKNHVLKTAVEGAETVLHCVLNSGADKESGLYYANNKVVQPSKIAQSLELQELLWVRSLKMVNLIVY